LVVYVSYLQREVVAAADEASRLYKEKIPMKKQSAKEEWEQMAKATASVVRSFRKKKIDKLLAVADPANGDDFMAEVCFHANNSKILVM
jgi:hypothetical protein